MPVSLEFLRGIVGLLGIGCAYMTGRSLVLYRKGFEKQFRFFAWVFRTVLCLGAVVFRHAIDSAVIVVGVLSAVAFGGAVWAYSRKRPEEPDLTKTMFPPEDE
jgi:hypothetical protein